MDKHQIVHDLAIAHVIRAGDAMSPEEQLQLYFEMVDRFKQAYDQRPRDPTPTAKVVSLKDLGF